MNDYEDLKKQLEFLDDYATTKFKSSYGDERRYWDGYLDAISLICSFIDQQEATT